MRSSSRDPAAAGSSSTAVPIPIACSWPSTADPALGPPDRRGDPEPSARGPRRWPGAPARALPRRPRVRAWDAWTGSRLCRVGAAPCDVGAPVRLGLAAGDRLDVDEIRFPRPLADPRPGSIPAGRWRHGHQQRLGRAARRDRPETGAADGRRRGGHRPIAPGRGVAAGRLAQGGAPRQQDRDHGALHRGHAAEGGRGVGGRRQPVWSPGQGDAGSARRGRRSRPAHGSRRHGRRRLRGGRHDASNRGRCDRRHRGRSRAAATWRGARVHARPAGPNPSAPRPRTRPGVPVCDPGHRAGPRPPVGPGVRAGPGLVRRGVHAAPRSCGRRRVPSRR